MTVDLIRQRPTGEDRPPAIGEDITGWFGGGQVIAVDYDTTSTLTVPRWVCVIRYADWEERGTSPYATVRAWHAHDPKTNVVGWAWDGLRAHATLTDAAADFAANGGR